MALGADIYSRIGDVFGGRLYPLATPPGLDLSDPASYPNAVYRFDEANLNPALRGSVGSLAIIIWDETPDGLAEAKEAVRDLLDGWKDGDVRTCVFGAADDIQDSGTDLFQSVVRYRLKYMQR